VLATAAGAGKQGWGGMERASLALSSKQSFGFTPEERALSLTEEPISHQFRSAISLRE